MEYSPTDGPQVPEPVENISENLIDICDDELWDSIFGSGSSIATGDQALPEPPTTALGFAPLLSNSRGHSSSLHPLCNQSPAGARFSYEAIQSRTGFRATFDTGVTTHRGGPSDTSSHLTFDITHPYDPCEVIGTRSTGHEPGSDNKMPLDPSYRTNCGLEQQLRIPSVVAETTTCDTNLGDLLLGFDGSFSHGQRNPVISDALADNRAGYITSDNSATPYSISLEDHRREEQRNVTYMDEDEEVLVEHPSGSSPVWRREHQLGARSASDRSSPSSLSLKDSSLASSSTISSTSATTITPTDDSWKCSSCGRVLATKGTKNRNRNQRRHRCPGTGPKYPCAACPKSFNRGDTRLLHLRKWHPEIHIQPPRPRKRKNL